MKKTGEIYKIRNDKGEIILKQKQIKKELLQEVFPMLLCQ